MRISPVEARPPTATLRAEAAAANSQHGRVPGKSLDTSSIEVDLYVESAGHHAGYCAPVTDCEGRFVENLRTSDPICIFMLVRSIRACATPLYHGLTSVQVKKPAGAFRCFQRIAGKDSRS